MSATNVVGTSAYSTSNPTLMSGTPGDDGVINGDDGLGGAAPCLDSYIAVQESQSTGADPHAVHGIEAQDGAFVAVGSGS